MVGLTPTFLSFQVVAYEQKQRIAPLLDVCIQFIADNVGDVESLGSLSGTTRDRVNAIICECARFFVFRALVKRPDSRSSLHRQESEDVILFVSHPALGLIC